MVAYPWEKLSDLKQAIYPEGFYNVRAYLLNGFSSHHCNYVSSAGFEPFWALLVPYSLSACCMAHSRCRLQCKRPAIESIPVACCLCQQLLHIFICPLS